MCPLATARWIGLTTKPPITQQIKGLLLRRRDLDGGWYEFMAAIKCCAVGGVIQASLAFQTQLATAQMQL